MPVQLADQSVMTFDFFVTLPIRFTPYHYVCNIVFRIVPSLTHVILLRMKWFSLFLLVVNCTLRVVTLTIDEPLELKYIMPRHPLITISTTEQFKQMLSNLKCKHKAFSVYIHALEGAPEHATLQDVTGHPDLSIKPA